MTRLARNSIFWTGLVIVLSSIFRISNLDLIEFKADEATTLYQTVQFFEKPYLIQRGLISGTGVYNFPLFNYLMIGLAIFSQDPQILSGIIAIVNSLLIGIFFLFVRNFYDDLIAIYASLLLAVSPWGILFSRKIWAQDLINLLLIPFLWLLHELILRKNIKVVLPLFVLMTLLIQLHGSGLFLALSTVIAILILRIRLNLKNVLLGILIGLIPALPYFFFQISSSCSDCEAFFKYQQSNRTFSMTNFLRPFEVVSGLGYYFILGRNYPDFVNTFPIVKILKYIFATSVPVILLGIVFLTKNRKYIATFIYFLTIPFLYFVTKTTPYMHYFVILLPVSVLLFAFSLSNLYALVNNKYLKHFVMLYFFIFIASNILFTFYFYSFIRIKKNIDGDYGPIYTLTKESVENEIKVYSTNPKFNLIRSYAYIYVHTLNFQTKLDEFMSNKE